MDIKKFFKVIIFLLIFLLVTIPLTTMCVVGIGNIGEIKSCSRELYNLNKNTMDVLYIGSSSTWAGVSPPVIYNETGIAGFNRSCTVQTSYTAYYYLLEALQHQNPKVVVLESETMFSPYDEAFMRTAVDSMKPSDVKNEAIDFYANLSDSPLWTKASFYIPYLYYNKSWSELNFNNLYLYYSTFNSGYNNICPMGGRLNSNINECELPEEKYATCDEVAIPESISEEYFVKILNLCNEKDIQVMVVTYPNATGTYAQHNKIAEICKDNNTLYCDLMLLADEIGVDPARDFSDAGEHMNIYGNVKVSKYIAKLLNENFDLPDRRGSEGYEFYDAYLETFLSKNGEYLK